MRSPIPQAQSHTTGQSSIKLKLTDSHGVTNVADLRKTRAGYLVYRPHPLIPFTPHPLPDWPKPQTLLSHAVSY